MTDNSERRKWILSDGLSNWHLDGPEPDKDLGETVHVTELRPDDIVLSRERLWKAWLKACAARLDGVVEFDHLERELFGLKEEK